MEIIAQAYMHYQNDWENSDKIYYALLEKSGDEYVVRGRWGRRGGASLQEQVKYRGGSYYDAEEKFTELYHAKMAKGYALVELETAQ